MDLDSRVREKNKTTKFLGPFHSRGCCREIQAKPYSFSLNQSYLSWFKMASSADKKVTEQKRKADESPESEKIQPRLRRRGSLHGRLVTDTLSGLS